MENWKPLSTVTIEVPVRSPGNIVANQPVEFEIFKDSTLYKAIPQCEEDQKRKALLKDEIIFSFRPDKAVAAGGINDGNQHVVERIGAVLKEQGVID